MQSSVSVEVGFIYVSITFKQKVDCINISMLAGKD
jgi:hypothetical protein